MTERDFYYWLQGFFELSGASELSEKQVQVIKEHMALVSRKVTETSAVSEIRSGGAFCVHADDWNSRFFSKTHDPASECSTSVDEVCNSPQHLTC